MKFPLIALLATILFNGSSFAQDTSTIQTDSALSDSSPVSEPAPSNLEPIELPVPKKDYCQASYENQKLAAKKDENSTLAVIINAERMSHNLLHGLQFYEKFFKFASICEKNYLSKYENEKSCFDLYPIVSCFNKSNILEDGARFDRIACYEKHGCTEASFFTTIEGIQIKKETLKIRSDAQEIKDNRKWDLKFGFDSRYQRELRNFDDTTYNQIRKTDSESVFIYINDSTLGGAWVDHAGTIWGDAVRASDAKDLCDLDFPVEEFGFKYGKKLREDRYCKTTFSKAKQYCESREAHLPNEKELYSLLLSMGGKLTDDGTYIHDDFLPRFLPHIEPEFSYWIASANSEKSFLFSATGINKTDRKHGSFRCVK